MEKITRLEGYDAVKGQEGSAYKSGCPIHSNIYYGGISITGETMLRIAMYAKCWWGQVGNERKIHWKNWSFCLGKKMKVGWVLGT